MAPVTVTVIGGGFAGLVAAITAAESGATVTLHEAHRTLGGRARTRNGPFRTNDGPHALYNGGPHWAWLKHRRLLSPLARLPLREALRLRYHRHGALRRMPPLGLLQLARHREAPVDTDFHTWAASLVGEDTARAAANFAAVALFHHDPGSLSAAFTQERFRRAASLPPEAHYPRGGWQSLIDRMAGHARRLGVDVRTGERVTELPADRPVVVATPLASAASLLGDSSLSWHGARTMLIDLAVARRPGDAFAVSDLDAPGWIERFTAQDPGLAPRGNSLIQAQFPHAAAELRQEAVRRGEALLDQGFPGWRERTVQRRESVAVNRTGAIDPVGHSWRDRPAIDRGDGVYLAGDQVAAPGVLSEVSFNSAVRAAQRALAAPRATTG